jgi:hypothetical protein
MLPLVLILALLGGEIPSFESIEATPRAAEENGMIEVSIDVVVMDDTDPAPLVRLFRVTAPNLSDDDYQLTGTHTVLLRAGEEERVYTLHVEAIDRDGNRGTGSAQVTIRANGGTVPR